MQHGDSRPMLCQALNRQIMAITRSVVTWLHIIIYSAHYNTARQDTNNPGCMSVWKLHQVLTHNESSHLAYHLAAFILSLTQQEISTPNQYKHLARAPLNTQHQVLTSP